MFSLTRNLFDDLSSLHRELDGLFDRTFGAINRQFPDMSRQLRGFSPEMEAYSKGKNLVYRMSIPGIDPKDVDLSITGNQVTVRAERKNPTDVKDDEWLVQGFYYGSLEHSFTLPEGAEADKVDASFHNGVLEITVPAAKAILPRKIEIKQLGSGSEKVIGKGA